MIGVDDTIIFCRQVEIFPHSSVAVHVTIVVPKGKTAGALLVTKTPGSQLSVAEAMPIGPT